MEEKKEKMPTRQKLLTLLCFLFYTISYVGRYSYSANINPIIADYQITKAAAGLAPSFFFFAYGIGQVVHGLLCKRYPRKYILPLCMSLSACINCSIFFGLPFPFIKYLWFFNGFLLATLWPSIILTISRNIDKKHLQKSILVMSASVASGTFLSYGFSAIFMAIGNYKLIFIFSAVLMFSVAVVWLFSFNKLASEKEQDIPSNATGEPVVLKKEKKAVDLSVFIIIICLSFMAVCVNIVRDGLHTWVPTILKENYGLKDSISILLSIILPVFGIFAATVSIFVRKIIHNFVTAAGALYAGGAIFVGGLIFSVKLPIWLPMMIIFCVLTVLMGAINNIITSVAPLFMREKVNSGLVAGILNGCCYVGSTISSYGLGGLADYAGWNAVFFLFLGICIFSVVVSFVYTLLSKKKFF